MKAPDRRRIEARDGLVILLCWPILVAGIVGVISCAGQSLWWGAFVWSLIGAGSTSALLRAKHSGGTNPAEEIQRRETKT